MKPARSGSRGGPFPEGERMKKLLQILSSTIVSVFLVLPYAGGAPGEGQKGGPAEELVSGAPAPAPACGRCGDHYCSASCGETALTCPKDCGATL